jgi:hypothetical protein
MKNCRKLWVCTVSIVLMISMFIPALSSSVLAGSGSGSSGDILLPEVGAGGGTGGSTAEGGSGDIFLPEIGIDDGPGGGGTAGKTTKIDVIRVNQAPMSPDGTYEAEVTISLSDNIPSGTTIRIMICTYNDEGQFIGVEIRDVGKTSATQYVVNTTITDPAGRASTLTVYILEEDRGIPIAESRTCSVT